MADGATDFEKLVRTPNKKQLKSVGDLANKAIELSNAIADSQDMIAAFQEELNQILQVRLPAMLDEAGMADFTTTDGFVIELKDYLSGTLPKEAGPRAKAIKWIEDNEGVDLIRNKFNVELDKGDEANAKKIREFLRKFNSVRTEEKVDVNHQSFLAFIRERMRNGAPVDLHTLGLHTGKAAKITAPKKAKGRR